MIYITKKQTYSHQVTWDEILAGEVDLSKFEEIKKSGTITRKFDEVPENLRSVDFTTKIIATLKNFNNKYAELSSKERTSLYSTFYIPKASGGMRKIDNPCDELKTALTELKLILENVCELLYHTSAFAYVKGRCTKDMVIKHQMNDSNWFLKTDFSGFFPNTTLDFIMSMMSKIYPMCMVMESENGYAEVRKAMELCMLNGGLPQGTPISPTLTNIICIPIDHALFNTLADKRVIYTRYADDMEFSCVQAFNPDYIIDVINNVLKEFNAPWSIKKEKTHYGSRAGKNWCLGLMLNKDNNITIGHGRKKEFKAMLCNFAVKSKEWSIEDMVRLKGLISYYRSIEPDYINYVITHTSQKFYVNIEKKLKELTR